MRNGLLPERYPKVAKCPRVDPPIQNKLQLLKLKQEAGDAISRRKVQPAEERLRYRYVQTSKVGICF